MLGLSLSNLLAAAERNSIVPKADACIILHLNGGPSHLDMWDMKPEAPEAIRGEFKPIASSLVGIPLCEHLPKLATHMHRAALVRSMNHSVNNSHAQAVYVSMTGHDRGDNQRFGDSQNEQPSPGAMLARLRSSGEDVVPHVALPYKTKEGAGGPPQPGFWAGWLGRAYDPLWILKDPSAADFSVPEFVLEKDITIERMARRGELLTNLNGGLKQSAVDSLVNGGSQGNSAKGRSSLDAMSRFQHQALDVLTSDKVRKAMRIEEEPANIRDAYGRNIYGQSTLLARRLIESGTRVVTLSWAPDANATWDTHGSNFKKLKGTLLPQLDAACGSLLTDLVDRGMLERTLVVVTGDFGRTPKINANDGGRDHWNYCYTVMLAGGGIKPGFVYGASDKTGAFPADRPTSPGDVIATMYALLGLDPDGEVHDFMDRPHRIAPKGDVLVDLIA